MSNTQKPKIQPGFGRITPPHDVVRFVFPVGVLDVWRKHAVASEDITFRIEVLEASGPYPLNRDKANRLRSLRAVKAAWETYLHAAYACGMFEGEKGKVLLGQLRSAGGDGFRSGMAECMTCWFLAGRMKLPLDPYAPGRDAKNLEMLILTDDQGIGVEVKAPFRARPKPPPGTSAVGWLGDDSHKISQCMQAANKQFDNNRPNILVIVPGLRMRVFGQREDVVRAAYGESKMIVPINVTTGEAGPRKWEFFPEGKFLNACRPDGKPLKEDGFPAHRRISAILCIEEREAEKYPILNPFVLLDEEHRSELLPLWEKALELHLSSENAKWIEHNALVLHNPFAFHPLDRDMWKDFPQFLPVDDEMKWTDGYNTRV